MSSTSELNSPFTLPAAIDYLDAIWRLRFNEPLVEPPGLERSARIAFSVGTVEEADSALSALAEVLKTLNVPGMPDVGGHPLQRLVPFLRTCLPEVAMPAIQQAIIVLDAVRQVRASSQHIGTQSRAIAALDEIGLVYPIADWPAAWTHIQRTVAHSCDTIRQELHAGL